MLPFNLILYLRLIATVLLVWEMGPEALGLPIEMLAAIPASLRKWDMLAISGLTNTKGHAVSLKL